MIVKLTFVDYMMTLCLVDTLFEMFLKVLLDGEYWSSLLSGFVSFLTHELEAGYAFGFAIIRRKRNLATLCPRDCQ